MIFSCSVSPALLYAGGPWKAISSSLKASRASSAALRNTSRTLQTLSKQTAALSVSAAVSSQAARQVLSPVSAAALPVEETSIGLFGKPVKPSIQTELLKQRTAWNKERIARSTFIALTQDEFELSGTVFKTTYDGKEEVFGVIASHAIASFKWNFSGVRRHFTAQVFVNGKPKEIKAEIVQVGAMEMLDISLVKFQPEDEKLFEPLVISPTQAVPEEWIETLGFMRGEEVSLPERPVVAISPISLRSYIQGTQSERLGLCGSAILNQRQELVGVHTGSTWGALQDLGYATHAKYLNALVDAYHNGGEIFYPVEINGHIIAHLRPDEYISEVTILDEQGRKIVGHRFTNKFSFSYMKVLLEQYAPRYMDIKIRRSVWSRYYKEILIEHSLFGNPSVSRIERYDFETGQRAAQKPSSLNK